MNTTKPYRITRERPFFATIGVITLCLVVGLYLHSSRSVLATDNNFADGITVDSKGDGADANLGDSICDDGNGNCTLRAAIEESNQEAGTQTIRFNITGTADFTNIGQNGYTITPAGGLPYITDTAIIDGYTQPGSQANTAIAPNPLNGILLIELDGSVAGATGLNIFASNTVIRGLVINNCTYDGIGIDGENAIITGNYIGTDPLGTVAMPNIERGVGGWGNSGFGSNATIGGLNPEDRNLISGNGIDSQGSGMSIGPGHNGWKIQGNYIGLGADGVSEIPNAQPGGAGNPSVDFVSNTVIGGSEPGAINVISGNNGIGIAPNGSPNTRIEGNYIGTDYTGTIKKSNDTSGIAISDSDGSSIIDNIISGNENIGISISGITGITVQGNKIGTGAVGNENLGNTGGIGISSSDNVMIGGANAEDENIIANSTSGNGIYIYDNATDVRIENNKISSSFYSNLGLAPGTTNIEIIDNFITDSDKQGIFIGQGSHEITIQGNEIKYNNDHGVDLNEDGISNVFIGGTANGTGNVISNNVGYGIGSSNGLYTSQFSAIGNTIFDNGGLGIDLNNDGPTINDSLDSDSGSNNFLNFPEYINISESGGDTTISYHLDVPAGNYRIEYFSNAAADPSGYGEGETYLGYQDITHPGGGRVNFSHMLTGITGVTSLAMTTTQRNMATPSGFGATSEFSDADGTAAIGDLSLTKTLMNPEDATIGAVLTYQFTITNEGPDPIDLSKFLGSSPGVNNLITDVMPTDIVYAAGSVNNPSINCFSPGAGSASMFGPALAHHSDHALVFCAWGGAAQLLNVGSSISFSFDAIVQPSSDLGFNNYAIIPPSPVQDPDGLELSAIFSSGQDILDELPTSGINNFSYAQYPVPEEPETAPISTNTSGSNINDTGSSLLGKTGEALCSWYGLVSLILSGSGLLIYRLRRKHI